MYTPEQIAEQRGAQVRAIFDRFEPVAVEAPVADNLEKSVETEQTPVSDTYWTREDLETFKNDLFKGIDEGTLTEDDLQKAQDDLFDLVKSVRTIDGQEVEVFVKG